VNASLPSSARRKSQTGLAGMWFFVVTETMFFFGLFFAWYYLRVTDATGQLAAFERPEIGPAILNTVLTVLSVFPLVYAERAVARDDQRGLVIGMVAAAILGVAFIAVQVVEFSDLSQLASDSAAGSVFIFLLFFHVARVLIGVGLMAVTIIRALMGQFSSRRRLLVQATAIYWYFIVAVWLTVFVVLYLL
jgi:cytochrome c oxidase subunit III